MTFPSRIACAALTVATLLSAPAVQAAPIFYDDFNSNSFGFGVAPTGFTISGNGVDIIGRDSSGAQLGDVLLGNGLYLDLDGTYFNGDSGLLSTSLTLAPNTRYLLSARLAGSQLGSTETVDITFGNESLSVVLAATDPFQVFTLGLLSDSAGGPTTISFRNRGGDRVGALLDRVQVDLVGEPGPAGVPEPGSLPLAVAALAALRIHRLRRRR